MDRSQGACSSRSKVKVKYRVSQEGHGIFYIFKESAKAQKSSPTSSRPGSQNWLSIGYPPDFRHLIFICNYFVLLYYFKLTWSNSLWSISTYQIVWYKPFILSFLFFWSLYYLQRKSIILSLSCEAWKITIDYIYFVSFMLYLTN